ncbi:MAG: TonB-dependent receptor plug domain-containing protein, partial [Gammaproteobacteria bacterium]|nr:TonB-dependent receptor plug domain-containing protein [Gammaproteobacteria bacterium]
MNRAKTSITSPVHVTIAAIPLLFSSIAVAQSTGVKADDSELDEIVVRATRLAKRVDEVPGAISVVTKNDIQLGRQQLGLDESLAAVPGLFMQDRYNFAQDLRIAIRGFGARSNFGIRGVKILVDGIPESLPDGQGQSDGIDLGSAEQIEVMRGPASSLYGNASGGVINITSERGPAEPFVEARLSTGEFGFDKYQLKAGGNAGRLNYLVNVSEMQFDGYREHSETKNTALNARFVFAMDNDSELGVVVNTTDQPVADDPGSVPLAQAQGDPRSAWPSNLSFNAGESLDQQRIGLSYKKSLGERHAFELRNHYVWRDFANLLPFTGGGIVEFDRFFAGGGASYTYSAEFLGRPNTLIVGIDIDRQDDDRRRYDNNSGTKGPLTFEQEELVNNIGLFVQNEIAVSDEFSLT